MHSVHTLTAWDNDHNCEVQYLWCERCGLRASVALTPPNNMKRIHLRATDVFLETSCSDMLAMRATHWFETKPHWTWIPQYYYDIKKVNEQELGKRLLYMTRWWRCKICGYEVFTARAGARDKTAHFVMHEPRTCERHQKLVSMKRALG